MSKYSEYMQLREPAESVIPGLDLGFSRARITMGGGMEMTPYPRWEVCGAHKLYLTPAELRALYEWLKEVME